MEIKYKENVHGKILDTCFCVLILSQQPLAWILQVRWYTNVSNYENARLTIRERSQPKLISQILLILPGFLRVIHLNFLPMCSHSPGICNNAKKHYTLRSREFYCTSYFDASKLALEILAHNLLFDIGEDWLRFAFCRGQTERQAYTQTWKGDNVINIIPSHCNRT